jgi:CO/xanthine dehydrogenase FAD-binding subunit
MWKAVLRLIVLKPINYLSPRTIAEALQLMELHRHKAYKLLAGGTDLVVRMKEKIENPEVLIDLGRVEELVQIEERADTIHLGSMVTCARIISSALLNEWAPILVAACRHMGSPQIRSRATIGGNIANASPAGDTVPPLLALDASLEMRSTTASRTVALETFFCGPGQTILAADELITTIQFPKPSRNEEGFFLKLGQRRAMSISKVSVAGQVQLDGGRIVRARIAYGAVASTPIRAYAVEDFLRDKPLEPATVHEAVELAQHAVSPVTDIRSTESYRRKMSGVLLRRALESLMKAATAPPHESE